MEPTAASEIAETTRTEPAAGEARQPRFGALLPMLLFDIAAPIGSYYVLHAFGVGDVIALTAGGLIAGLRAVYTVVRDRKVDGFAVFVLSMFAFGLVMTFVTGDARFVLAKDSFGMGLSGLVILGTCVFGKPFTYYSGKRFYKGGSADAVAEWEQRYQESPGFRATLLHCALIWGIGLAVLAALVIALIYQLPVVSMVAISNGIQLAGIVVLIVSTQLLVAKRKRQVRQEAGQHPAG